MHDIHQLEQARVDRLLNPVPFIDEDYRAVYERGEVFVGWPDGVDMLFSHLARQNTVAIIGAQLGDEGKGRVVDNKIEKLLQFGANQVYVVRYQGGANAGHTIISPSGERIALHQVPSGILYEEAVGIMDSGMIIHMEDLQTEIRDAEMLEDVGDLRGKLILSPGAMLCTDLDRAQEWLNRTLTEGKSSGGTGRGIAPTAADRLTRRGLSVGDLFADDWRSKFEKAYDQHETEFRAHGETLAYSLVPDLNETRKQEKPIARTVGTKQEFIARLEAVRQWFIERDIGLTQEKRLLQNTYTIYQNAFRDLGKGFLFEGAQAVGLDPRFGRIPDVTSTNTTVHGIPIGTQFPLWSAAGIEEKFGVIKATYQSSVGSMRMITDSGLERRPYTDDQKAQLRDEGQAFAAWVRDEAHEFGTTTGRARDICFMDLPLLRFNAQAGAIEMLAATHMDIAQEGVPIKVCTHYEDMQGNYVPYQPGLEHQKNLIPQYIELDGWDGKAARKAQSFDELPENAKKYLAFLQRSVGLPIVFITTGPARENAIEIPNYREV